MENRKKVESFAFEYTALQRVHCGASVAAALKQEIEGSDARRVLLVGSRSLSQKTSQFAEIRDALGTRYAGLFDDVAAHTPRADVMRILELARSLDTDLLVTLGGGSIIDAAKAVQLALDQQVYSEEVLLEYAQAGDGTRGSKWGDFSLFGEGSSIRQIAVPTTLSGAEFSNNAGVTNSEKGTKEGYKGIDLCPRAIIYDPALTVHTPQWLWLSTAIRSLDHAIEGYCSADANAFVSGSFLHAMRLFSDSLPGARQDPADLLSRSLNQQAVWLACNGLGRVSHGASHGIGYILGALCGVPHGYTSCVMLPAVLRWNQEVNAAQQKDIATALGFPGENAGLVVKDLVSNLGLPTTLQAVGVGEDQLAEIAARALRHPVVRKNPRPIDDQQQIMEILRLAWE